MDEFLHIYHVRLPPIFDEEAGEVHRITMDFPLYEPVADHVDAALVMDAENFAISENGLTFNLPKGRVRYTPEGWKDAFVSAGLQRDYTGGRAVVALRAVMLVFAVATRGRGQRGAGKKNQDAKDWLLADALVRIADGSSYRDAACAALAAHPDVSPWPFASAENILFTAIKRQLATSR